MRINQLIQEVYVNLKDTDLEKREKYKDEVFNLVQNAYKAVGGMKGSGFSSPDDMVQNLKFWKLCIKDGKVVTVILYKDVKGRKAVAMATDGTLKGTKELKRVLKDDGKTGRSFSEVSDNAVLFIKKLVGKEAFDGYCVPAEEAVKFIDPEGKKTKLIDGEEYEYQRLIGGQWITKRMMGNINAKFY